MHKGFSRTPRTHAQIQAVRNDVATVGGADRRLWSSRGECPAAWHLGMEALRLADMKRVTLLAILLILPYQFTWAAVSIHCNQYEHSSQSKRAFIAIYVNISRVSIRFMCTKTTNNLFGGRVFQFNWHGSYTFFTTVTRNSFPVTCEVVIKGVNSHLYHTFSQVLCMLLAMLTSYKYVEHELQIDWLAFLLIIRIGIFLHGYQCCRVSIDMYNVDDDSCY